MTKAPILTEMSKGKIDNTKTTYKYTKDKNPVSNQYTLFDSSRFSRSDCGSPPCKNICQQANIVGRKIVAHSGIETAPVGLQA